MYLSFGSIALLCLVACVLWFWQDSLRVRDLANGAAMQACRELGLQFLDGTVAFSRLRLVRDRGRLRIRRTYVFDYTAHSVERMQGFVLMLGSYTESVGFARQTAPRRESDEVRIDSSAHPIRQLQSPDSTLGHDTRPSQTQPLDNVLDLDAWRKRHMRQ